jgi:hypothetical protein
MDSDYYFGIFWPLCCLFFFDIRILITPLVSFGHCVVAKRYQRGNQNPHIEEEQTTQWPKDTKGVIRIRISKKNRQHNGQTIPKVERDKIDISSTQIHDLLTFLPLYCFFWPLCCLFFFNIRILITPLVSFGHCVKISSHSVVSFYDLPIMLRISSHSVVSSYDLPIRFRISSNSVVSSYDLPIRFRISSHSVVSSYDLPIRFKISSHSDWELRCRESLCIRTVIAIWCLWCVELY